MSHELIEGHASESETRAYARRISPAPGSYRHLGDLTLASVGLGTYLGPEDAATDASYSAAVRRALELGLNVLDSAINYRHQRSERSIGRALRESLATGLRREEVFVATKGGFLPFDGALPPDPRGWLEQTYLKSGLLGRDELVAGCHAIAPRFLSHQIDASRRNLGVATIDLYYLHNPEVQLSEVARPEFLTRMRGAFEALESACGQGRIAAYGCATWNGFRVGPRAVEHLSLEQLVRLAREVAGEGHHFRAVQLPYNLAMPEAFSAPTQRLGGREVSMLEAASELGVYVMTSASVMQGRLTHNLPQGIGRAFPGLMTDAQRSVQFVRSTPGVGTALVGMRQPAHVHELAMLAHQPAAGVEDLRTVFAVASP